MNKFSFGFLLLLSFLGICVSQNGIYPVNVLVVLNQIVSQDIEESLNIVQKMVKNVFILTKSSKDVQFKPNQVIIQSCSNRIIQERICDNASCVEELMKNMKSASIDRNGIATNDCLSFISQLDFFNKDWGDSERSNYSKMVVYIGVGGYKEKKAIALFITVSDKLDVQTFYYRLPRKFDETLTVGPKLHVNWLQHRRDDSKRLVKLISMRICNNREIKAIAKGEAKAFGKNEIFEDACRQKSQKAKIRREVDPHADCKHKPDALPCDVTCGEGHLRKKWVMPVPTCEDIYVWVEKCSMPPCEGFTKSTTSTTTTTTSTTTTPTTSTTPTTTTTAKRKTRPTRPKIIMPPGGPVKPEDGGLPDEETPDDGEKPEGDETPEVELPEVRWSKSGFEVDMKTKSGITTKNAIGKESEPTGGAAEQKGDSSSSSLSKTMVFGMVGASLLFVLLVVLLVCLLTVCRRRRKKSKRRKAVMVMMDKDEQKRSTRRDRKKNKSRKSRKSKREKKEIEREAKKHEEPKDHQLGHHGEVVALDEDHQKERKHELDLNVHHQKEGKHDAAMDEHHKKGKERGIRVSIPDSHDKLKKHHHHH